MRAMTAAGLLTILGALVPFAVRQFVLPETAVWRISAAVLCLAVSGQFVFAGRASRPLFARKLVAPVRFERFLAVLSVSFSLALGVLAVGLVREPTRAIYALAILYLLALSSHHFFLLILAAHPSGSRGDFGRAPREE